MVGIGSSHFPFETVALAPSKMARVAKRENFIIFTFLIFFIYAVKVQTYKDKFRGSIYDFAIKYLSNLNNFKF